MNENIRKFLQKVAVDESMQAKMKSFTNIDDAYEYAKSIQDGFSKEEFTEVMKKISEASNEKGEITDDELANVAGGYGSTEASIVISVTSFVVSAAASV